jgi:NADH-quinone oxidoreductase subunit K
MAGFISRKNIVVILLSLELMLNAAGLSFVTFSRLWDSPQGQVLAIFSIAVAAAEVAVALAVIILIYRKRRTVDVDRFNLLKD